MNKTFVASLNNHNIYLISDEKVSFYINVLKQQDRTNITIDIGYKHKNKVNDIINYYSQIDDYNISLIIPLLKFEEKEELFKTQSNKLSLVINYSYKLLTSNNVLVNDNINMIKHSEKSEFLEFFTKNFASRVRYITIDDLVHEEVPYNKVNALNMSFVVGRPELELTIKDDEMQDVVDQAHEEFKQENNNVGYNRRLSFASGYVSYYLLGFLTAVITLLAITFLINK